MESLALLRPTAFSFPSQNTRFPFKTFRKNPRFGNSCFPVRSQSTDAINRTSRSEYKPGLLDDLILAYFRRKMVEEVGWDSEKLGYDGLMEVVNRLMAKGKTNLETQQAAVRVLRSLFPPFLVENFQRLIAPIGGGKLAAMMVFIERCKYLEESKCVGICIHTCKLPTQTFFKDYMGVPLLMEPNFSDFSCQFYFGVHPPVTTEDKAVQEPCLEICPNASRRRELSRSVDTLQCPKV